MVSRVFIPSSHDQSSSPLLPTLFTIHGGGFFIGTSADDDAWNRLFADTNSVLVIALNYAKTPANPFPGPLSDVQALLHAALRDSNLPIDKSRLAVAGFSAGGNLALTLARVESLEAKEGTRDYADLKAVVPIYPVLDHATPAHSVKMARRRWKVGQLSGLRGRKSDFVLPIADISDWAYIPYGQNLRDPALSPFYAARDDLPAHVFVVAAELDMLAWEAWAFALRLAGKTVIKDPPGREGPATTADLVLEDERFHWNAQSAGRSVRWLLVPDVLHSFDIKPVAEAVADAETVRDGNEKAVKVIGLLGEWMKGTAWSVEA